MAPFDSAPQTEADALPTEERYELAGTVERVTFHNPDTGFSVLKVKAKGHRKPVALVAHGPTIEPGERVRARGTWIHDKRYGLQFKAEEVRASVPRSAEGMERYLASGLVEGIGPVRAARLVKAYGDRALEIIQREPWRLQELLGLGEGQVEKILSSLERHQTRRDLVVFLGEHGIGPERAARIHEMYGSSAPALVRADPYRLARDVRGIGFGGADQLARSLGVAADDPARLRAGLVQALRHAADEGSCGLPLIDLVDRAARLLAVEAPKVARVLAQEVEAGALVRETADGEDCVFAGDLYRTEAAIADRLLELNSGRLPWGALDVAAVLRELGTGGVDLADSQRAALRTALSSKVLVMTGGPGVGKTTLVRAIVTALSSQGVRVALAAPTGRAAKRLAEATGREAGTLHRLLEVDPAGGFRRNRDQPLELDLLVVDEASMVDVRLMGALLSALPTRAALLLVGDADQLPSVGPGRVLADILTSGALPVVRLTEVFRQAASSRIVQAAHRVNAGHLPETGRPGEDADFYIVETRTPEVCMNRVLQLVQERIPARFGLDPVRDVQVLCPMNKGALGAVALNEELRRVLNPSDAPRLTRGAWSFALGDKVMQVENDHEREVYNGDLGIVTALDAENSTLEVTFDGRAVSYAGGELDRLVLAYATSVHKAQGSEYPAVVIPLSRQHGPMLQRNLLYTAITRGRQLVVLVGDRDALVRAVADMRGRPRRSTLRIRLMEKLEQRRRAA
ncbi:SF1B family DNA helicase RecD2 [Indioceanicola profundi]|uniref:SF1B family DNA helicase RecD2 n=1 Tax=Indioceanicola profundi TaxID=2220096 RepID=UPI000E6AE2CC|nr:ATP-dependent RecD-like DNA helicase [Indioceanicola profundi]